MDLYSGLAQLILFLVVMVQIVLLCVGHNVLQLLILKLVQLLKVQLVMQAVISIIFNLKVNCNCGNNLCSWTTTNSY